MRTPVKAITVLVTAAILGGLFVGGVSAYAPSGAASAATDTSATTVEMIASRWDHEERTTVDTTTPRALRWDHEERSGSDTAVRRASRWDHEER